MKNIFGALALLGSASIGFAGAFTNGSFESPGGAPNGNRFFGAGNDTFVTGWTHIAGAVDGTIDFYSQNAAWGINADNGLSYIGFGGTGTTGGILFQTFDTIIGTTYTVNYRLTSQQGATNPPNQSVLVEALNGAVVLNNASSLFAPAPGTWISGTTLTFVAASLSSTLRFTDTSNGPGAISVNWGLDNVTLDSSAVAPTNGVPEPATYSMVGLGLGLIALRRYGK